jgi:hypothetical protein
MQREPLTAAALHSAEVTTLLRVKNGRSLTERRAILAAILADPMASSRTLGQRIGCSPSLARVVRNLCRERFALPAQVLGRNGQQFDDTKPPGITHAKRPAQTCSSRAQMAIPNAPRGVLRRFPLKRTADLIDRAVLAIESGIATFEYIDPDALHGAARREEWRRTLHDLSRQVAACARLFVDKEAANGRDAHQGQVGAQEHGVAVREGPVGQRDSAAH